MSSPSGSAAGLGLEPGVSLRLQHLHLVAQLGQRLAVAVVGAGHVAGHFAAIAAEQAIERQLRHLTDQVPARDVDRGGNADDRLARPALLARAALPGQREELLVDALGRERVHADDELGDAALESGDRGLDRRVARRDADPLEPLVGLQAHENLVGARHDEMADPMGPVGLRRAQDVDLQVSDLHIGLFGSDASPASRPWRTFRFRS